ncbi:MAG: UDP-glucose 4-epimerase GalE [Candidatus Limnocylindrales bacterium]
MRILVTGGAGYVGSVSVERLLAAGHEVVVLDDLSTGHRTAADGARLVEGTYADGPALLALLEGERIEAILHCAARSLVPESIVDPARYYRDNVAGGVTLLEAARTVGVRRVVFSSTAAVYGIPTATPIPEDAPLAPINPYGETKRTFEAGLRWYGSAYGLRSVALRYFNVAGASDRNGECHEPETHLIPNVLAAAETGRPVTIFGTDYPTPDGTNVRDYIHVQDLADGHLAALDATAPTDPRTADPDDPADVTRGRAITLNLGSAAGFSVREVIAAAERVVGRPIPTAPGSRRPGDPPILVAANDRAGEVLGWTPRRGSLGEMIGSAWAWRRRHPNGYRVGS